MSGGRIIGGEMYENNYDKMKGNVNALMGAVVGPDGKPTQPGQVGAGKGQASPPKQDMSHLNQLM